MGMSDTVGDLSDLEELISRTKARVDKAKKASKEPPAAAASAQPAVEDPSSKRRRQDMGEDERREFDQWISEIRDKRWVGASIGCVCIVW